MTTKTATAEDKAWMEAYLAAARREVQDELAASAARLRALAQHLAEAAKQDDPYHWLAVTPVPGQPGSRKAKGAL